MTLCPANWRITAPVSRSTRMAGSPLTCADPPMLSFRQRSGPTRVQDPRPMSVIAPGYYLRWFARPLILAVAVLVALFAATSLLGLQYWEERQAAHHFTEHSRQVLETLDRLRAIVAELETERRGYLHDPRPRLSQGLRRL